MPVISIEKQRADAYKSINDWQTTMRFRQSPGDAGYDVVGLLSRIDAQSLPEASQIGGPVFTVMVVHEASRYDAGATDGGREYSGLNIADVRDGISTLEIARRPGEAAKARTVRVLDDSDDAALYVECR